ncbi:hypothetical protein [Bartonella bovis]|nr:hypothetical protein [Bartonella bovis]
MESSKTLTMNMVTISGVEKGVEVTSGNLTVNGGTMTDVGMGIRMLGKGTLKISGGTRITVKDGVGNYGIGVGGMVTANITGAMITGSGSGTGKGVWMDGTGEMKMNNVQISDVAMGVEATGGNLTISGNSTITFNNGAGNYGVRVGREVTARLTDVRIVGTGSGTGGNGEGSKGVEVSMGSSKTMTMTDVTISGVEKGVLMNGTGTLRMTKVDISGVKMGVEATAGRLEISGHSRIMFNNGADNYGVKVKNGVTMATLTSVTIAGTSGNGEGSKGVWMEGKTLEMTNVDVLNVGVGVEAKKGGTLTIKEGKIGFKKDYGIGVWGTATATITGTTITGEGKGKGVYATGVGEVTLTMTGVNISNVAMGIEATAGTLTIKGGEIGFKDGRDNYGIGVGKSVTLATVTGTTITGEGSGTGVLMMETKMMRLDGVTISNVGEGVWVKGRLEMNNGSITVTGNGVKGYGMGVYVGKEATANISGTMIRGAGMGSKGVVMNGKTLGMSGVNISNVAVGVEVTKGILAMKGGSIGFMGEYGVSLKEGGVAFLGGVKIEGNGTGKTGIKLNGGMIDMFGTNIRDVHKGMSIENGIVRMFGGEIGFTKDYGVSLNQGGFCFFRRGHYQGKWNRKNRYQA